jgi:hypothetical protein
LLADVIDPGIELNSFSSGGFLFWNYTGRRRIFYGLLRRNIAAVPATTTTIMTAMSASSANGKAPFEFCLLVNEDELLEVLVTEELTVVDVVVDPLGGGNRGEDELEMELVVAVDETDEDDEEGDEDEELVVLELEVPVAAFGTSRA